MKIVWLCNYSLKYLKARISVKADISSLHPTPWIHHLKCTLQNKSDIQLTLIILSSLIEEDQIVEEGNVRYFLIKNTIKRIFERLPLFNFQSIYYKFENSLLNLFIKPKILRQIKIINPDLVNLFGTEGEYGTIINQIRKPKVIWILGLISQVIQFENNFKFQKRLSNEHFILKTQNNFITVKSNMEDIINSLNPKANFYNIFFPLPAELFKMFDTNFESKWVDVIFVSQLIKRKGVEDLIEAVRQIVIHKPNISVKIIGFGTEDYQLELNKKIWQGNLTQNIDLVGFVEDNDTVMNEIKGAKLLVLPTYVDTGPRILAESMAIGTTVVAYNVDGIPSIIKDNFNGILVEKGNVNALADVILRLLNDDEERKRLSQNGYDFAKQNFSPSVILSQLVEAYRSIILNN